MAGTEESKEIQEMREALASGGIASIFDSIKSYFDQLDQVELNIAVTGETGSGKSTFVNAFRGLKNKDVGAAPTGVVETTKEPTSYPHPTYQKVTLWDLPGIGSQTFKAKEYLGRVNFQRYDFFIIVASERIKENHVMLAKEIKEMKKNFYFVRSKIDQDVKNAIEDKGCDEKTTLEDIRNNCIKELQNTDLASVQVFLISSRELRMYDFSHLHKTIDTDLPKLKKHLLLLAVPNISPEIHEKKKEALKANIWKVSLLSAGAAAVPIPGISVYVDMTIILRELGKYYKAFGLDDQSMLRLADKSGKPLKELKAQLKSPLSQKIDQDEVIKTISRLASDAITSAAKHYLSLIPGLGLLAAGALSFTTTFFLLHGCLDDLAEDAKKVLQTALGQLT